MSTLPNRGARAVGFARAAVSGLFLINGLLFGAWASRVPAFVARFDLDPGVLGRLLLCLAAGAIVSFAGAGRLSDGIGAASATRLIAAGYVLSLPLLALAPGVGWLALALVLFGAFHGAMDVTMNAWAAEVERAAGRPIMSSVHAMWSLGAGLGAASGWAAVQAELVPGAQFLAVAGVAAVLGLTAGRVRWVSGRAGRGGGGFALPPRVILLVGVIALCSSVGEGAMADWSAVFLHQAIGSDEARAALGYFIYSAAIVAARLGADWIVLRLGPVVTARICGGLAAAGVGVLMAAAALGLGVAAGLAGFALLGLGYSALVPLAFSRAGSDPEIPPGRALAGVATLGYGGAVVGPVAIGAVAQATSLGAAFGLIGGLALVVVALAGVLRPRG